MRKERDLLWTWLIAERAISPQRGDWTRQGGKWIIFDKRVWEYDYAWDKNIRSPVTFLYSWCSKLTTILRSYCIAGTLRLISEVLKPGRD